MFYSLLWANWNLSLWINCIRNMPVANGLKPNVSLKDSQGSGNVALCNLYRKPHIKWLLVLAINLIEHKSRRIMSSMFHRRKKMSNLIPNVKTINLINRINLIIIMHSFDHIKCHVLADPANINMLNALSKHVYSPKEPFAQWNVTFLEWRLQPTNYLWEEVTVCTRA